MSRLITAKYQGTCTDCGAPIYPGEQCEHYARGKIRCMDCHTGNDDGQRFDDDDRARVSAPAAPAGDKWAAAMQWDTRAPAPGASLGEAHERPRAAMQPSPAAPEQPRTTVTQIASQETRIAKRATELANESPTAKPEQTSPSAPTPAEIDVIARLIHEQLVTTLNAIGTLSLIQRRDIARACAASALTAGNAERAELWRKLGTALL